MRMHWTRDCVSVSFEHRWPAPVMRTVRRQNERSSRAKHRPTCGVNKRHMKRLIAGACLLIALVATVVLLARRGSSVARPLTAHDASLLVVGLTNFPKGSFAIFCLSNNTVAHIACVPEAFEE